MLDLDQAYCVRKGVATFPLIIAPEKGRIQPCRSLRQHLFIDGAIQLVIRLGLLGLLIVWTFLIIRPFVPILTWSAVLAVAFYPAFSWLAKRLGGARGRPPPFSPWSRSASFSARRHGSA